ncbi:MAG: hypothetical protein V1824_03810 [archaeon]
MKKTTIIALGLIIAFVFLILSISVYFESQGEIERIEGRSNALRENQEFLKFLEEHNVNINDYNGELKRFIIGNYTQDRNQIDENHLSERERPKSIFFSMFKFIMPFMAFIGLIVGILVYKIMNSQIDQKENSLAKNTKIILKLLSQDQRKVIECLIENKGAVRQYEIGYLPDMNKLKAHRILRALEKDNIVEIKKLGKTNKVILNKDIYEILK